MIVALRIHSAGISGLHGRRTTYGSDPHEVRGGNPATTDHRQRRLEGLLHYGDVHDMVARSAAWLAV